MKILFLTLFLSISKNALSQSFLESYSKFSKKEILKYQIKKKPARAKINRRIQLLDSAFQSYREKTGFDFDKADSIGLFYHTGAESRLNYYLIVAGKDTLSFKETWISTGPSKGYITFEDHTFFDTIGSLPGYKRITESDSLISLSKMDCAEAQTIASKNRVMDGTSSTFIHAIRNGKRYFIKKCYLGSFGIFPFYRKQN